ncbi:class E sortase [Micromonospora craniellae]|nr:class E sortase [Micromonospora craniellae]QOC90123.1 class E sortase [Micromonospora craniellae]
MRKPALVALLAVAGALLLPSAPAAAAEPAVTVDQTTARLGEQVTVQLVDWPAGVVTAALCGNEARQASADCAVTAASAVSVPASGSARLVLHLAAPPVGCPCVIRAVTATGDQIATVAIDVPDVPDSATVGVTESTAPGADGGLVVVGARVEKRWSLAALFGGPAPRVLMVTVDNTGTTPVSGAELALDLGRAAGAQAPGVVPVEQLEPGARTVVEVPFTVSAPAMGRYDIGGRVDGIGGGVTFTAQTSAWPWLLPLVPLLAVLVIVLAYRLHRQRRRAPSPMRTGGVVLVGAGLVCAVVLAAQTLMPGVRTADAQQRLDEQLTTGWEQPAEPGTEEPSSPTVTSLDTAISAPAQGKPLAVLHVPKWRAKYTIVEGIRTADLKLGPGHYPGTALPGEVGNMAVAGHRGPPGEPFNDIDQLGANDPIVVETASAWFVYRVQRHVIVSPERVDVVAPTPEQPGVTPSRAMLTMTACHPRYSSRLRYVLFSELDQTLSKLAGERPDVLG